MTSAVARAQQLIGEANSPEALAAADVIVSSSLDSIRGKQQVQLHGQIAAKQKYLTTELGSEDKAATDMVDRAFAPPSDVRKAMTPIGFSVRLEGRQIVGS